MSVFEDVEIGSKTQKNFEKNSTTVLVVLCFLLVLAIIAGKIASDEFYDKLSRNEEKHSLEIHQLTEMLIIKNQEIESLQNKLGEIEGFIVKQKIAQLAVTNEIQEEQQMKEEEYKKEMGEYTEDFEFI